MHIQVIYQSLYFVIEGLQVEHVWEKVSVDIQWLVQP